MARVDQLTNQDSSSTGSTSQVNETDFQNSILSQSDTSDPNIVTQYNTGTQIDLSDPTLVAQLFPTTPNQPILTPRIPGLQQDGTFGQDPAIEAVLGTLGNAIGDAIQSLPANTTAIIGTRINAIPADILNQIPAEVRRFIPADTSAAIAIILPKNTKEILANGGNAGDVLANSTLWLGIIPPTGAFSQGPLPGMYVMTWNKDGFDFRAGYAGLTEFNRNARPGNNPLNPANGERFLGIPGIGVNKSDPSNWLFFNAGVSWSPGSGDKGILESLKDGQEQLQNALQINRDSKGNIINFEMDFANGSPNVGAVTTWGDLHRVPGSRTAANRLGETLINAAPSTGWFAPLVGGFGLALRQSTGLYVGIGGTASRVSLGADGEFNFSGPGFSNNANIFDIPAVGGDVAGGAVRGVGLTDAGNNIDRGARPSRQTLTQIINTPTNVAGNQRVADGGRLSFYLSEYIENTAQTPASIDAQLARFSNNANATQRLNIDYLRDAIANNRISYNPGVALGGPALNNTNNPNAQRMGEVLRDSYIAGGHDPIQATHWTRDAFANGGRAALEQRALAVLQETTPNNVTDRAFVRRGMGEEAAVLAKGIYDHLRQNGDQNGQSYSPQQAWSAVWANYISGNSVSLNSTGLADGGNAGGMNALIGLATNINMDAAPFLPRDMR